MKCRGIPTGDIRDSRPEAIEGRQAPDWRIGVRPPVDIRPEKGEFTLERFLIHHDPPGLRTAIASVRPAIAACFQVILHVEGAVFGTDADARMLPGRIEFRKRWSGARILS